MDKVKKTSPARGYMSVSILIVLLITFSFSNRPYHFIDRLLVYCQNDMEVNLSHITDFDWDTVYIDRQYYKKGEEIQEKYGIIGEPMVIESDFCSRIAFCKDGVLVHDLILNNFVIEIDISVEVFYPDSILTVEWVPINDYDRKKLYLSLLEQ